MNQLDVLINDLERTLPVQSAVLEFVDLLPALEHLQLCVHAILYGTPEDVARVERDPHIQSYLERLGRARQSASRARMNRSAETSVLGDAPDGNGED